MLVAVLIFKLSYYFTILLLFLPTRVGVGCSIAGCTDDLYFLNVSTQGWLQSQTHARISMHGPKDRGIIN